MKRALILLLSAVLMTAALTGCSSGEEDALVSKTPFPEFSEVDIAGDEISSDCLLYTSPSPRDRG